MGQRRIPLLPVLHSLGVSDRQLEETLGKEPVEENNKVRLDRDAVIKAAILSQFSQLTMPPCQIYLRYTCSSWALPCRAIVGRNATVLHRKMD